MFWQCRIFTSFRTWETKLTSPLALVFQGMLLFSVKVIWYVLVVTELIRINSISKVVDMVNLGFPPGYYFGHFSPKIAWNWKKRYRWGGVPIAPFDLTLNGCAWQMNIRNFFVCSQGQLKRNIVHNFVQTYDQVKYILKQSKPSIILFYSKK